MLIHFDNSLKSLEKLNHRIYLSRGYAGVLDKNQKLQPYRKESIGQTQNLRDNPTICLTRAMKSISHYSRLRKGHKVLIWKLLYIFWQLTENYVDLLEDQNATVPEVSSNYPTITKTCCWHWSTIKLSFPSAFCSKLSKIFHSIQTPELCDSHHHRPSGVLLC